MSEEEAPKRRMETKLQGFVKMARVYSQAQTCYSFPMIQPEQLVGREWAEWYRLTPAQRWLEREKLWQTYLALGGSLDPEPDTQSPFFDARTSRLKSSKQRTIEMQLKQEWRNNLKELRHSREI